MATSFDTVQNRFLYKVSDRNLLSIEPVELEGFLDDLLISSLSWFRKSKTSLSNNTTTREFTADLEEDEIEILSLCMVQQWLKPQVNNVDVLRQNMSTREYKMFSQANHIDSLLELHNSTRREYKQMIREYIDLRTDLDDLYSES